MVVVPVGTGGKIALYNGSAGTVQLVADVWGWYSSTNAVPVPVSGGGGDPVGYLDRLVVDQPGIGGLHRGDDPAYPGRDGAGVGH